MNYRLRILPEADQDIDRIFVWIAGKSRTGAVTWFRRFLEVVKGLRQQPLGYGTAPESTLIGREIRQVTFKTRRGRMYRLLFEIRGAEIIVLHVRGPGQRLLGKDDIRRP